MFFTKTMFETQDSIKYMEKRLRYSCENESMELQLQSSDWKSSIFNSLSQRCSWGVCECWRRQMFNPLNPRRFPFYLPSKIAFLAREYAKIAYPAGWNYKVQNSPGRVVIFDHFLTLFAQSRCTRPGEYIV